MLGPVQCHLLQIRFCFLPTYSSTCEVKPKDRISVSSVRCLLKVESGTGKITLIEASIAEGSERMTKVALADGPLAWYALEGPFLQRLALRGDGICAATK